MRLIRSSYLAHFVHCLKELSAHMVKNPYSSLFPYLPN